MSTSTTVAIVGRPNVGKSTLFNRLVGRRQAIVHDLPGVTRDRVHAETELGERQPIHLLDTGGLVLDDDVLGLNEQVFLAIEESQVLIFVVDGKEGLTAADVEVAERLRKLKREILLVVNKADVSASAHNRHDFYQLGMGEPLDLSAEHGRGLPDLLEALRQLVPVSEARGPADAPRLAVVGRPNVGKSSILNRLLGEPRALVSPVAGTTRDPVDSVLKWGDREYIVVDTAGIRRRSRTSGVAESLAVMMARRQVADADLAVLVVDASAGVTSGDLGIAGSIWEKGRPAVVAVNKWDLLDDDRREHLESSYERLDELLSRPERINLSAETARGVPKLLPAIERTFECLESGWSTSQLNQFFADIVVRHRPPTMNGKSWKLFYVTQVANNPPTFILFANRKLPRSSTYRRYLENQLREAMELRGVPIRLVIKNRSAPSGKGHSQGDLDA